MTRRTPNRRDLLKGLFAAGGLGATVGLSQRRASASEDKPKLLVVLSCFGGANILDSFLPVATEDALTDVNRGTVLSHDVYQPEGSNLWCVDRSTPKNFLDSHGDQMAVLATQSSSVNHWVAQARSVNGRGVNNGRTLQEAVADWHGAATILPNVNMGRGGFAEPGTDTTLASRYTAEIVTNPVTYAFATSGYQGLLPADAVDEARFADWMQTTRALRDGTLEDVNAFARTFTGSAQRRALLRYRSETTPAMEAADLITELMYVQDMSSLVPLDEYGLSSSPCADAIEDVLNDALPTNTSGAPSDRLEAQAALAYLLLATGTSVSVTLTEPGTDGFLAFDQSHSDHRSAQKTHWDRVLDVADRLIGLLKDTPDGDGTLWDRTLLVFATEFGRDKWDTGDGFGSGHHLNNGLVLVSPMLAGNQVLGGVDPDNGFTYGFDPDTGESTPFEGLTPGEDPLYDDENLPPGEELVYGTLAALLEVEYDGQETISALLS